MADFMFQNMAYRATVYRTGVRREVKILGRQNDFWINQKIAGFFELQWNLELNDSLF